MNSQDYEELSKYFYYDENTPTCLSRCSQTSHKTKLKLFSGTGEITNKAGYYQVEFRGKTYQVHRIICLLFGYDLSDKGRVVDHLDGNTKNNKIDNLRVTSRAVNQRNTKLNKNNTTGMSGVTFSKKTNSYVASVKRIDSKSRKYKSFKIDKYGREGALKLAKEWRISEIQTLNHLYNAMYTQRHIVDHN